MAEPNVPSWTFDRTHLPPRLHVLLDTLFDAQTLPQDPWHADRTQYADKYEAVRLLFLGEDTNRAARRNGTQSSYQPIWVDYAQWCVEEAANTPTLPHPVFALQTTQRAKAFLEHRMARARGVWHHRTDTGHRYVAPYEASSVYAAFRHGLSALHRLAMWQGFHLHLHDSESMFLLDTRLKHEFKDAKRTAVDSAATSAFLTKRLSTHEFRGLVRTLWANDLDDDLYKTPQGRERAQWRAYVSTCLLAHAGKRGDDVRQSHIRMLFLHTFTDVGPAPCYGVGVSLRTAKDDDVINDQEHLMGFLRARDRLGCPTSALANYLVWLNDVQHGLLRLIQADHAEIRERIARDGINATRRHVSAHPPEWYNLPLIPGRDVFHPISNGTHNKDTRATLMGANVTDKRKVTHLFRYSVLGNLLEGGVATGDAAIYQQWASGVMANTYARGCFTILAMLKAHGWEAKLDKFRCSWESATTSPPSPCLRDHVFPELDATEAECKDFWETHRLDRSAVEVCKVLRYLRQVFLDDSVHHRPLYPDFPIYTRHPIFKKDALRDAWDAFAVAERVRCEEREALWDAADDVSPVLARFLERQQAATQELQATMMRLQSVQSTCQKTIATDAELPPPGKVTPARAPAQEHQTIPEMQDPHPSDLGRTYALWADAQGPYESVQEFFHRVKRPSWKNAFDPTLANTMKQRYHKMMPFFEYVDRAIAQGHDRARVVSVLQTIANGNAIDASVFVKQCVYYLSHSLGANVKRPPPLLPEALQDALRTHGLPT